MCASIQPTVFIALGGVGIKVCSEIYELLDRYVGGADKYYKCLQFVFIDTDHNDLDRVDSEISSFHKVHCECDPRRVLDNLIAFGVGDWFPDNFLVSAGVLNEGASQIRPYGRLAFFNNYIAINAKIDAAICGASSIDGYSKLHSSPRLHALGLDALADVEVNTKFVIVSSIAGGTGGGMLIDILGLLRNKAKARGYSDIDVHIIGASHFAYLPGVDPDSVNANAYACLKELNYFHSNTSIEPINANWNLTNDKTCYIGGDGARNSFALADHIFLYENENASGCTSKNIDDFYLSLARSIFRDYTVDDFAGLKRSIEDNMRACASYDCVVSVSLGEAGVCTRSFPQRFQSKGYAALAVPHDQMIEAASCRLAVEVIECLIGSSSNDVDNEIKDLASRCEIDISDLKEFVVRLSDREKSYYVVSDTDAFIFYIESVDEHKVEEILKSCLQDREKTVLAILSDFVSNSVGLAELIDRCRLEFVNTVPVKYDFWQVFAAKFPEFAEQKQTIEKLCRLSNYWLRGNEEYQLPYPLPDNVAPNYCCVPDVPSSLSNFVPVSQTVTRTINGEIANIQQFYDHCNHSRVEIIRYSPCVGICYSKYLDEQAKAYDLFMEKRVRPLHVFADEHKFEDIRILTPELAAKECAKEEH